VIIRKAIEELQKLEQKHGSEILIYFDCPECKIAFTPDYLQTVKAVHISGKEEKK